MGLVNLVVPLLHFDCSPLPSFSSSRELFGQIVLFSGSMLQE